MRTVSLLVSVATLLATVALAQPCFDYGPGGAVANLAVGGTGVTAIADDGVHLALGSGTLVVWCDLDADGQPVVAGSFDLGMAVADVAVDGSLVLVAAGPAGLCVLDFSVPSAPALAAQVPTLGRAVGVAAAGGFAYLADREYLRIFDLAVPAAPGEVQTIGFPDVYRGAFAVAVSAGRCWTVSMYQSVRAYDVTDPTAPMLLRDDGDLDLLSPVVGFEVVGGTMHVLCAVPGEPPFLPDSVYLRVVDVSVPTTPVTITEQFLEGTLTALLAGDETRTVLAANGTAAVYDLADPGAPPVQVPVAPSCARLHLRGQRLDAARGASLDVIALDRLDGPVLSRTTTHFWFGADALTDLEYDDGRAFCRFDRNRSGQIGEPSQNWVEIFSVADPANVVYEDFTAYAEFWKSAGTTSNTIDVMGDYLFEDSAVFNWTTDDLVVPFSDLRSTVSRAPAVYAVQSGGSLEVHDATDPASPVLVATPLAAGAVAAALRGDRLAVGLVDGLAVYDVGDPLAPTALGTASLAQAPGPVAIDGALAAVGLGTVVQVVRTGAGVVPAGTADLGLTVRHLAVRGPVIYAAADFGGSATFAVIDATDPDAPVLKGSWTPLQAIAGLALAPTAVLASEGAELVAYAPDCLDPGDPSGPAAVAPATAALRLGAPVPNPFNPATELRFELAQAGAVELAIYDAAGRKVRTLLTGGLGAGPHAAAWDGRDDAGRRLAAGVYLARLAGGRQAATRKLVLIK